jgi:predicted acyl esterase
LVDYWERVAPGSPGVWVHHEWPSVPVAPRLKWWWLKGSTMSYTAPPRGSSQGMLVNDDASMNFANDSISKEIVERDAHGPAGVLEQFPESPGPLNTVRYAGPALPRAMRIVGSVRLVLPVTSSARRTAQVTAKLYDVGPDGSTLLTRACQSLDAPVTQFAFTLWPMAHTFAAGHHVELSLSTVDFPTFEPDLEPAVTTVLGGARIEVPIAP